MEYSKVFQEWYNKKDDKYIFPKSKVEYNQQEILFMRKLDIRKKRLLHFIKQQLT